jgi:hypothetical protein
MEIILKGKSYFTGIFEILAIFSVQQTILSACELIKISSLKPKNDAINLRRKFQEF